MYVCLCVFVCVREGEGCEVLPLYQLLSLRKEVATVGALHASLKGFIARVSKYAQESLFQAACSPLFLK